MTTKLLLHCNSGLPLVDETGRTVTGYNGTNGVYWYATPVIFVGGVAYVAGYNGYFEVPASTDFAFGTGNFKLRVFVRLNAVVGFQGTLFSNLSGANGFRLSIPEGNSIALKIGAATYSVGYGFATSANYFIDATRISGVLRFAVGGTQVGSDIACADDVLASSAPLRIGGTGVMNDSLYGWFDEAHIDSGAGVDPSQAVPTQQIVYPDAVPQSVFPASTTASQFGAPTIQRMIQEVYPTGFAAGGFGGVTAAQFYTPSPQSVYHINESREAAFGTPTLGLPIVVPAMTSLGRFGTPRVADGGITAQLSSIASSLFGQPALSYLTTHKASGLNTTQFGQPLVAVDRAVSPHGISGVIFGRPTIPSVSSAYIGDAIFIKSKAQSAVVRG